MAIEIQVETAEDFQDLIDNKDFRISKAIVDGILSNLTTKKKYVHVLSIVCMEDGEIYDITVDRKFFADTLDENLKYYIENEQYEDCQRIVEAMASLKK